MVREIRPIATIKDQAENEVWCSLFVLSSILSSKKGIKKKVCFASIYAS